MDKKELRRQLSKLSYISRRDFDTYHEYQTELAEIRSEILSTTTLPSIEAVMQVAYSDNQRKFIADAKACGLEVDYGYSGRGMYGDYCPAVRVDEMCELTTTANWTHDNMGRGWVMYARS